MGGALEDDSAPRHHASIGVFAGILVARGELIVTQKIDFALTAIA